MGHRAQSRAATSARSRRSRHATLEELEEVEGIGPDRAGSIAEWFGDKENLALVGELRGLGVQMAGGGGALVEGRLTGSST